MTWTFNNAIPAASNNPSSDQPIMLNNNIANFNIWAVDHIGFNVANGGFHQQIRMPVQAGIPAGTIGNSVTLWGQTASGTSQLFSSPGTTGDSIQLTRMNHTNFALFGANTNNYNGVGVNFTGGWTFLPGNGGNIVTPVAAIGGMIFQYGTVINIPANSTLVVPFPFSFTTACYAVNLSPITSGNPSQQMIINAVVAGLTSFTINNNSSTFTKAYWTAIGV